MMNTNTSKHQMSFSNLFKPAAIVYIQKDELRKEVGFKEFISGNADYINPTGGGVFGALLFGVTKETTPQSPQSGT